MVSIPYSLCQNEDGLLYSKKGVPSHIDIHLPNEDPALMVEFPPVNPVFRSHVGV